MSCFEFAHFNSFKVLLQLQLFSPNFLKFWTPPHDFALIIESFELLVCVLIFNGYKSLTLDQDSDFDCVIVYGGWHMFSLILLVDRTSCSLLWVAVVEV